VSRLEELGIRKVVEGPAVSLYVRGNCLAAVGQSQGSTGLLTESGLAYLVWKGDAAFLASKGAELPATPEQVAEIRRFTADLKDALTP
jgi:hypothetical protein